MSWQLASLLLLGGSTVLLFIGLPVAFAFMAINIVGAILFLGGDAGLSQMLRNSAAAVINFSLTPIPLFVLMGEVRRHTGNDTEIVLDVPNVLQLFHKLGERYPTLKPIIEEGFAVSIDGQMYEDALFQPIGPESEVILIPKIAGG